MQENDLLGEGLNLMVFGMGFVFVFLSLLVVAMMAMARLVDRFAPAPVSAAPGAARSPASPAPAAEDDSELTAVMAAAIHRFRQDQHKH
ncbi:sodium pump decarboxylase subunit gamma [Halomonas sp. GDM18]|nr:sodium pump decarboxylase subunit gamma [Halomonas sp. SF2003]TCJ27198.1 sodium pump decarboxylase subunit gamma [Halomonas sp. GDM18]